MERLTQYADYRQYKEALDTELQKTAEGFVRIGYLLKVARDTDILKESGYKSVTDFAMAEYNIDKSQVSRFIHINDRFAEGGYSERLLPEYQGYGYAKLTLMLSLPDEINGDLSPDFSKAEIQAVKEEYEEEQKISDIEVMIEDKRENAGETVLERLIWQMFKENADVFKAVWEILDECVSGKELDELICPDKSKVYIVRIPGEGRYNICFNRGTDNRYINQRDLSRKGSFTWDEFWDAVVRVLWKKAPKKEFKEAYREIFGESFPEDVKAEVAPVQPKKETKVVKAKPEKPKEEPKEEPKPDTPAGREDKEPAVKTTAELISSQKAENEPDKGKFIREGILESLIEIEAVFNEKPDETVSPEKINEAVTKIADVLKDIGEYKKMHNMEVVG